MRVTPRTIVFLTLLLLCCPAPTALAIGQPRLRNEASRGSWTGQVAAPVLGAYATGTYRNLFIETGHSAQDVRDRIDTAFRHLFHGDPSTETVYYPAGSNANGPLAYLSDINNNDVRSEGMSYGMMIAVQLDKKTEFDALWNWAKSYMYRDESGHPGRGYFSWSMRSDGTPNDEMPAPDGEEYFATSLYFAAARWGNGAGIYDYLAAADRLLTDMRRRATVNGPTLRGIRTAGAMFNPEHAMVRFTPDTDFTDPSYHLPAFYELWARWGPEADRPFWARAATASRDFFQKVTHPATGLAPDYANFDGTLRGGVRDNFQYDAWRTAMNWSVDWSWWARDERERQLSDRLQAFFESKGMGTYGNRYTLDGRQIDGSHSTGLVATNAVASLAATHPRAKQFVEALWGLSPPSGRYRYYDGMLYLLSLLHCAGEFRIWEPRPQPRTDGERQPADQPVARTDPVSVAAHAQLLDKARKGRIDVYFEGDSIVRRWGATDYPELLANWNQNFFGWNAADFGWGADRVENILWRLENGELDGVNPKVIVLLAGTNNVGNAPPPEDDEGRVADITKGIQAILRVMQAKAPQAVIVVTGIFPRNDNTAVMPAINKINQRLATLADGRKIRHLNINDKLARPDGILFEGMMNAGDKLHPTVRGYQVWADALKPILNELLGPPAKEDHAPPPTGVPNVRQSPDARSRHGDHRSPHRAPISPAEPVLGKTVRIDPSGMPRSHDCRKRYLAAATDRFLHRALFG